MVTAYQGNLNLIMVADCGATCAKYVLCLFNFAFFVSKERE